jgi:hypothetical protein
MAYRHAAAPNKAKTRANGNTHRGKETASAWAAVLIGPEAVRQAFSIEFMTK